MILTNEIRVSELRVETKFHCKIIARSSQFLALLKDGAY